MVKHLFIATYFAVAFTPQSSKAQFADFESFGLSQGQYLNGSDLSGGYKDSTIFFPSTYDTVFNFWSSGFAISTMTDDSTTGFSNMYSSIVGQGHQSNAYAVVNAPGTVSLKRMPPSEEVDNYHWTGLWVTNSTYAYFSMLHGDGFAKKFGGDTGDDPDYFFVRIYASDSVGVHQDSLDFYLADFRDSDNSKDYILDEWVYINLTALKPGNPQLSFQLFSSDMSGGFINTPLFFCIDKVEYGTVSGMEAAGELQAAKVYPNPATSTLNVSLNNSSELILMDMGGRKVFEVLGKDGINEISVDNLVPGVYLLYTPRQGNTRKPVKVVVR